MQNSVMVYVPLYLKLHLTVSLTFSSFAALLEELGLQVL